MFCFSTQSGAIAAFSNPSSLPFYEKLEFQETVAQDWPSILQSTMMSHGYSKEELKTLLPMLLKRVVSSIPVTGLQKRARVARFDREHAASKKSHSSLVARIDDTNDDLVSEINNYCSGCLKHEPHVKRLCTFCVICETWCHSDCGIQFLEKKVL